MCAAKLPVTTVPADGPYHEEYPANVRVSEFVSSRSIEPFYDTLEALSAAGARVTVMECDQQYPGSGPTGCKGWAGLGSSAAAPPRHERPRYGLEELRVTVSWEHADLLTFTSLPKVTPVLATLSERIRESNGKMECKQINHFTKTTVVKKIVAKPLFYEILKAYHTQAPFAHWTSKMLFDHEWEKAYNAADTDGDYGSPSDNEIIDNLDPYFFKVITLQGEEEEIPEPPADREVFKTVTSTQTIYTGECSYHYQCYLQAIDLKANQEVLLEWLVGARPAAQHKMANW